MAVGERVDLAALGTAPDNFEVHRVVSQIDVLAHAKVLLSHAGVGGLMEALREGIPLVVVPHTPEQEFNARRVVELGLGEYLPTVSPSPAELRQAVERVATDSRMAARVAAMRQEIAAAGGTCLAADIIESRLVATD